MKWILLLLITATACMPATDLLRPHQCDVLVISKSNNKITVLLPGHDISDTCTLFGKLQATQKIRNHNDSIKVGDYLILLNEYRAYNY